MGSHKKDIEKKERKGFLSLAIDNSYRTGRNDLTEEFYIPCLRRSVRYDRAAGYFDTKSLSNAADGVSALIKNEGRMRLVVSPHLKEEDFEAIRDGKVDETIESALLRGLSEKQFADYLKKDRLKCVAWMLEQGFLDIRVAFMKDGNEANPFAHYHEKMGVFTDEYGNKIAFSGSLNETELAWTENYESFDVFRSWNEANAERVSEKQKEFEKLWKNNDPRVEVKEIPEVVEDSIKKHSPGTQNRKPDLDPFQGYDEDDSKDLWDHQSEAIEWWISSDYSGILSMATGTGKTYTALRAARLQAHERITIVVVPQSPLIDQWIGEIKEVFGEDAEILECQGGTGWRDNILAVVDPYRTSQMDLIRNRGEDVIVSTIHTAASDSFQKAIQGIPPERIQIIADEVHNYGAPTFQRIFDIDAGRRIGLSATPDRKWDEEGTQVIRSYFGENEFEFKTEQAIENGYLTEYDYHPFFCELRQYEYEEFKELTSKIKMYSGQLKDAESDPEDIEQRLEKLLRDRAKIKKKADNKPEIFEEVLLEDHPLPAIIFCEDNDQIDDIEDKLDQNNKKYSKYVSKMPDEKQERAFYKFKNGLVDYLLAIDCLDEGIDVPGCPTAILISSTTNERQYIQRRGRVLRKSESKEKSIIYDIITLPPFSEAHRDENTRSVIEQEIERAKILIRSAENRHEVESRLNEQLNKYELGFLVYT